MKSNILPIYLRELKSTFYSPVAYLVLLAFLVLSGFFWMSMVMGYSQYSMMMAGRGGGQDMKLMEYLIAPFIGNEAVICLFVLPLISMRAFSEEKKQGTIETLFTLPFSDLDILLGKFLAGATLLAVMLLPMLAYPALIADKVSIQWLTLGSGMLGLFLVGSAFLAMGMFTSSLTENQVVAAVLGWGLALLLWILSWLENSTSGVFKEIISQLSLLNHLQELTKGMVSLKDITYFLFLTAFALFATLRVLESKKWR